MLVTNGWTYSYVFWANFYWQMTDEDHNYSRLNLGQILIVSLKIPSRLQNFLIKSLGLYSIEIGARHLCLPLDQLDTLPQNRSHISVTGLSDYVTGTWTFHNLWPVTDWKNVKLMFSSKISTGGADFKGKNYYLHNLRLVTKYHSNKHVH